MIWKTAITIEQLNRYKDKTLMESLDIEVIEIGDDFIKATMPVDHRTVQPMGLLHGGASASLAETLGSVASLLCVPDLDTHAPVGIELNISHLHSTQSKYVIGTVTPIKIGKRLHFWNIDIKDPEGKAIAKARLTTMIIPQQKLNVAMSD